MLELFRPEKEAIRRVAGPVMHEMSSAEAAEEAPALEECHRQAAMNETVVNDRVGDPEKGHAGAGPDDHGSHEPVRLEPRPDHEQGSRDGRVKRGHHVIRLEASGPRFVMGPMNEPEGMVPHPPV